MLLSIGFTGCLICHVRSPRCCTGEAAGRCDGRSGSEAFGGPCGCRGREWRERRVAKVSCVSFNFGLAFSFGLASLPSDISLLLLLSQPAQCLPASPPLCSFSPSVAPRTYWTVPDQPSTCITTFSNIFKAWLPADGADGIAEARLVTARVQ